MIGCCVNFVDKSVFFTKNGEKLKSTPFESNAELYAGLSMRKNEQSVKVNFGEKEFYFNIKKYIGEQFDIIIDEILKGDFFEYLNTQKYKINQSQIENQIILDYLISYGYEDTYNELLKQISPNNKPFCYSNQKLKERKLILTHLRSKNFKECIFLIKLHFPNSIYSIYFIELCEIYFTNLFHKEITNVDFIYMLKNMLQKNEKYQFINGDSFTQMFGNNFQTLIKKTVEFLKYDKELSHNLIIDYIQQNFTEEIIFDVINKNILSSEFSIYQNEFELIIKQLILSLKENLKLSNPVISFIIRNKNFLEKLNKYFFSNSIKYSDLSFNSQIKQILRELNKNETDVDFSNK